MRIDELKINLKDTLTASHYRTILKMLKSDHSTNKNAAHAKNQIIKLWKRGDKEIAHYEKYLTQLNINFRDLIKK
jgi:hypothetical protein